MLYGITGVFIALAVLYVAVSAMTKIFPYDIENEK